MSPHVDDLPQDILDDVRQMDQAQQARREDHLARIGQALGAKRDEAVKGRANLGVERLWQRCEDAYNSIDDANRHEHHGLQWTKPLTMDGPVTAELTPSGVKSTIYVGLTARYVNAGHAKVSEILLPPDEKAFSFKPSPVPDLIDAKEDQSQVTAPDGTPLERDPKPEELPVSLPPAAPPAAAPVSTAVPPGLPGATGAPPLPGVSPDQAPGVPLTVKDLAEEALEHATTAAEKAEKRIYDWMVEGKYRREARKALLDAAKLGVCILKGPFPVARKKRAIQRLTDEAGQPHGIKVTMVSKVVPGYKRVNPWNFYPAPNCGEDPKDGDYIFERDSLSERSLRRLKGQPGYLADQIEKVLKEGPDKKFTDQTPRPEGQLDTETFKVWYFQGMLQREDFLALNTDEATHLDARKQLVHVEATLVNDTVIKAIVHPLEASEEFNYHVMPWCRRDGYWHGIGVAEQVSAAARIVTGATRALMNNSGNAAGPQIVIHTGAVQPAPDAAGNASWELTPWKIWFVGSESTIDDVRKAFTAVQFPDMQAALQAIIEYGFKLAEEVTNIPLVTQGQSGDTTPDTFGQAQLQDNNANQLLRSVGYTFDDCVTEPMTNQNYEWLLLDPDVPDDEKGDFEIDAHGSSTLVERAIQGQFIAQQAAIVKDPAFGINPRKWYAEYAKANRINPARLQWTEEEQAKIDSQPPPKDPRIEAAEIKSQTDLQKAQMDTDRDTVYVQSEQQKNANEHAARMEELKLKERLAILDYSNKRGTTIEETKAKLAETAMKLKVQKQLAAQDHAAEVLKPPTEPKGRAPKGQSFEK